MSWGHDDYMYMVYPLTFNEFLMKNGLMPIDWQIENIK